MGNNNNMSNDNYNKSFRLHHPATYNPPSSLSSHFEGLPLDPRPPPTPRPSRDYFDYSWERSNSERHTSWHDLGGPRQWAGRPSTNTVADWSSSGRSVDRSDRRHQCLGYGAQHGYGKRRDMVRRPPRGEPSSSHFQTNNHRQPNSRSWYTARNGYRNTRQNKTNERHGYCYSRFNRSGNESAYDSQSWRDRSTHHFQQAVRRPRHHRFGDSMIAPSTSTSFTERVAEHAMDMLRHRQSDISLVDNDFFSRAVEQNSGQTRRMSQSDVSQLPIVTMDDWTRTARRSRHSTCSEICAICTENLAARDQITILPCGHLFHFDCVGKWLSFRRTCPICRHEV